jgi:hypothetical protein
MLLPTLAERTSRPEVEESLWGLSVRRLSYGVMEPAVSAVAVSGPGFGRSSRPSICAERSEGRVEGSLCASRQSPITSALCESRLVGTNHQSRIANCVFRFSSFAGSRHRAPRRQQGLF